MDLGQLIISPSSFLKIHTYGVVRDLSAQLQFWGMDHTLLVSFVAKMRKSKV